jgi:hypothetical protein
MLQLARLLSTYEKKKIDERDPLMYTFLTRWHWYEAIDCACADGRFPVSASCGTIQNPDLLSSSETEVNPGIRSSKMHPSERVQRLEAIGEILFPKKWKAATLQPGLGLTIAKNSKINKSGIFQCVSWLSGSFFLMGND